MRVALVVYFFPVVSETFISAQFLGLLDRGHDVRVVCLESSRALWRGFPGLKRRAAGRVLVKASFRTGLTRWLFLLASALRAWATNPVGAARYLRRAWARFGLKSLRMFAADAEIIACRPDLIHYEYGTIAAGHPETASLLGARCVASFRGHDLNSSNLHDPHYYDEVWRTLDGVHCLGQHIWERARACGCPESMRHALIPPAIDPSLFEPPERPVPQTPGTRERPLRLLSVGRLHWMKGYEFALEAAARLRSRGIELEYHIVGGGDERRPVAFCRAQLGLEDCVSLLGARTHEQTRDEMEWADLFVHAAVSEGFCNAVLEAQAMALPVVCSDAGGLPENVVDGVTGLVVPRRDAARLAEAIERLCRQPERWAAMGAAGRERVRTKFNLAGQIDAFDAFYREVLSSSGQPANSPPVEAEVCR